jgi:hypothetical protein
MNICVVLNLSGSLALKEAGFPFQTPTVTAYGLVATDDAMAGNDDCYLI